MLHHQNNHLLTGQGNQYYMFRTLVILIIAQIYREIDADNDLQEPQAMNWGDAGTSYKLLPDGHLFFAASNKRAKIPRPIAFVSWVLKCSYMFMERTLYFINQQVHLRSAVKRGHLLQICLMIDWGMPFFHPKKSLAQMFGWPHKGMLCVALVSFY